MLIQLSATQVRLKIAGTPPQGVPPPEISPINDMPFALFLHITGPPESPLQMLEAPVAHI